MSLKVGYAWALKCLALGHSHEKLRRSCVARTQDPGLRFKHFTTEPRGTPPYFFKQISEFTKPNPTICKHLSPRNALNAKIRSAYYAVSQPSFLSQSLLG